MARRTRTMSVDNNDASLLIWALIAEFLSLSEVLAARLVSRDAMQAIQGVSPQKCGALLEQALRARNIVLCYHGSWDRAVQDASGASDMLIRDTRERTTSFDTMLLCFRVL